VAWELHSFYLEGIHGSHGLVVAFDGRRATSPPSIVGVSILRPAAAGVLQFPGWYAIKEASLLHYS
jgi:hypothetical protein